MSQIGSTRVPDSSFISFTDIQVILFRKPPLDPPIGPPMPPSPEPPTTAKTAWRKVNVQNSVDPLWDVEPARYRQETFEHVRSAKGVWISIFTHKNNLSNFRLAIQ